MGSVSYIGLPRPHNGPGAYWTGTSLDHFRGQRQSTDLLQSKRLPYRHTLVIPVAIPKADARDRLKRVEMRQSKLAGVAARAPMKPASRDGDATRVACLPTPQRGGAPSAGDDGPLLYPGPLCGGESGTTGPQGSRQGCRLLFDGAGRPVEKPGPGSRTCRAGCPASAKRGVVFSWVLLFYSGHPALRPSGQLRCSRTFQTCAWTSKREVPRPPQEGESSCFGRVRNVRSQNAANGTRPERDSPSAAVNRSQCDRSIAYTAVPSPLSFTWRMFVSPAAFATSSLSAGAGEHHRAVRLERGEAP